jgi:hypothetical protein
MKKNVHISAIFAVFFGLNLAHADAILQEIVVSGSEKGGWNGANMPENLSESYVRNFSRLPLQARLSDDRIPWSDSFWPSRYASIANRWQVDAESYSSYRLATLQDLRRMSREQLARMSPAEKYDVAMGDYGYNVTRLAWGSSSPRASHWAGICNGWSQAALMHDEPAPVEIVNPDGIVVPFASSDVKGLLSYFYALGDSEAETSQMGSACNNWGMVFGSGACSDIHPGSFHIALANQIGLMNEGFVAEVDQGNEKWNQPVFQYRSRVLRRSGPQGGAARGTVSQVLVETTMIYALESPQQWEPVLGTPAFGQEAKVYTYWLELDSAGDIIGGSWVSQLRPDFIWTTTRSRFLGDFEGLNRIYRPMGRQPGVAFPIPEWTPRPRVEE